MNQATQSLRLIRRACALLLALLLAGCGSDSVATESPVSVPDAAPAEPPAPAGQGGDQDAMSKGLKGLK